MSIQRASCQGGSLEDHYGEAAAFENNPFIRSVGKRMLSLLPMLSDVCVDSDVWDLTSMYDLWLLPSDNPSVPWLVQVRATHAWSGYQVRYKMAAPEAPGSGAFVEGMAPDEASACKLILIAMKRSGAWR